MRRNICGPSTQHKLIKLGVLKSPPMSLEHALSTNVVNPLTGEFRGKYFNEPIALRDALRDGYIQLTTQPIASVGVTLSDCIQVIFEMVFYSVLHNAARRIWNTPHSDGTDSFRSTPVA